MILIKNGRVVDPVTGVDEVMDVLIEGAHIEEVGHNLSAAGAEVIDAADLVVAPGLVDTHVHFRDPGQTYKEDILTGAAAAAKGGFTTVVCMANTKPTVDNVETLKYVQEKGEKTGIHVLQAAAISKGLKGQEMVDMDALAEAGAAGFTDDGIPIMDEKLLLAAMEKARDLDMPISLHEEDPLFVKQAGVNQGKISEQLNYGGASRTAEDVMVARDCMLALHTGAPVCIQHISSANSVELVRMAKKMGADVHAEATPHHFTLTSDDIRKIEPTVDTEKKVAIEADADTNYKMNPPLRTKEDVQALKEGLRDDVMDVIATDHAPHTFEDKNTSMKSAPFGIVGLETAACLTYTELVLGGYLTPMQMAEKMSYNPAKIIGIDKGDIEPGKVADIVIFDPDETYVIDKNTFFSKGRNTPFDGRKVTGKVRMTLVNGQVVYEDKEK